MVLNNDLREQVTGISVEINSFQIEKFLLTIFIMKSSMQDISVLIIGFRALERIIRAYYHQETFEPGSGAISGCRERSCGLVQDRAERTVAELCGGSAGFQ